MPIARRRQRTRRLLRAAMLAALTMAGLWAYGLLRFVDDIPEFPEPDADRTDAIVVLTGGSGRLEEGLRLLTGRWAEKLFVSGVYRGVEVDQLLEISRQSPENLACCIEIGHAADNTAGNAAETAAWMRRHGFKSLRIVTSSYHLPRSLLEFRYALPDARLVLHPVFADHVKRRQWWIWPGTAQLIVGEYNKCLLVRIRQWIEATIRRLHGPLDDPASAG